MSSPTSIRDSGSLGDKLKAAPADRGDTPISPSPEFPSRMTLLGLPSRQWIKIVVYSLLLVNFVHYVFNDLNVMRHAVHSGWKWHDWTSAFATTIDESAWFMLLLLFELETYLLSDEAFTRTRVAIMHAVRVVCYLFLAHTVYAFGDTTYKLYVDYEVLDEPLCQLVDRDLSFARNLEYEEVTQASCASIAHQAPLILFEQKQLVTDRAGFRIERELALADLAEVLLWLVILLLIESMVRLQNRGVTTGRALQSAKTGKVVLYAGLWLIAAYWGYRGHWVFVWDETLWILGFMAIGANLDEWRAEIEADAEGPHDSEIHRNPGDGGAAATAAYDSPGGV
ncbi:MAG: hypothetical protein AAGI88_02605 [Pseudomonadota bacterium]